MSPGLIAFERLLVRMRERNAELRPRVAEWLRQTIPTTGRNAAQFVKASAALFHDGGWRFMVFWGPRGPRQSPLFPIAPTVPVEPTETEVGMLGLAPEHLQQVPMAWLLEVLAEAWVDAGFPSGPIALQLGSSLFRGLEGRFPQTDLLRALVYKATAPLPPATSTRTLTQGHLVFPPNPLSLPETPASLQESCRAGLPGAALAWADALATAGDQSSADLLRWLEGFPTAIADRVRYWAGRGAFHVVAHADGVMWGTGEEGTEPEDNDEAGTRLAQLLAGWNVYYPAVEWLLRRLSLSSVRACASYFIDGSRGASVEIDLRAGEHLGPFEETMGVTNLDDCSPEQADGGA